MKEIGKLIRKPVVLIVLALVLVVAFSFGLITYLILPKFQSYQELAQKNVVDSDHLSLLSRNVASFESLDKDVVANYSDIVKTFVPDQNDALRFLVLNEIVAAASGVEVNGVQIVVIPSPVTQPAAGGAAGGAKVQSSSGLIGKAYAQTVPQQPVVSNKKSYSVKISIAGDFGAIEAYLANLKKTDRLNGVEAVSITSDSNGSTSAIVTVTLPLGDTNVTVSPDDSIVLTAQDKQFLDALATSVLFSASQTNNPTGRANPFK